MNAFTDLWQDVPYPVSRLAFTLAFMAIVVVVAVWIVRWKYADQLTGEIAARWASFPPPHRCPPRWPSAPDS